MQSHIKINTFFKCIIGLLPHERIKKQRINLKIEIKANEFLDYSLVQKKAKKYLKKKQFKILEKANTKLAKNLKNHFPQIQKIKIEIVKLEILKNTQFSAIHKKKYKK